MRLGRLVRAILGLLLLGSASQAAKVLVIYNPWASFPLYKNLIPQMWGDLASWKKDAEPANQFSPLGNNWWSFTFANSKPGDFGILDRWVEAGTEKAWLLYKKNGFDSSASGQDSSLNVDALLATNDTVWMVPDPLVGGRPRFLTQHPQEMVVEFWNPWESDFPGQAPSLKVGVGAWGIMEASPVGAGWYQARVIGFTNLDLTFRSANGSRYLGSTGIATSAPAALRIDSLKGQDTVWVHQVSEPTGRPIADTTKPRGRVVEVFNPWDGSFPFQMPKFQFFDGLLGIGMPIYDRCGWYRVVRYDVAPASVYFTNSTGATFGSAGMGSKVGFSLGGIWLAGRDTVRISPDSQGVWAARAVAVSKVGQCYLTKLGATIRDFAVPHPAFEQYDCGLLKDMVQDTLGPNRKPLASPGDEKCLNGTLSEWFRDIPSKNYSVCRDIPLGLNPNDGLYSYDDQSYFPIDDIDTTLDPFNIKYKADDGLQHNFHFCLESHAVFDYHPGQKFDFIGDDDVWVYINGKLAVDLGGVHVAESLSVDLDRLGLTEGKTYPFDFFFCERRTSASHMRITTSMNLRNPPEFELRETLLGLGKRQYDLFYHQKIGQGCDAVKIEKPTAGLFFLTGPQFPTGVQLKIGVQLGGLSVRADSARFTYDSLAMDRLKPGNYVIRVKMALDTNQYRDIPFVVDFRPVAMFVSHDPWSGKTGTSMPLDIEGWLGRDRADFAVPFKLDPVLGLRFCLDSTCTKVLSNGLASTTGPKGETVRLWVRGDSVGSYGLKLRNPLGDSTDFRSPVIFQDLGLRWVDSLGRVVQPSAILRNVGRPVRLWLEATQGSKRCDTCSGRLVLTASDSAIRFQNPVDGTAIVAVQFNRGLAALMVVSDLPRTAIQVRASQPEYGLQISWSPLAWKAWHLVLVDSSDRPLAAGGVVLDVSVKTSVWVRVEGVDGFCTTCTFSASTVGDSSFQIVDGFGSPATSVGIKNGRAKIDLIGGRPGFGSLKVWGTATDTAAVPVTVTAYRLVFLDAAGNPPGVGLLQGEILQIRNGTIQVMGRDGLCTTCSGPINLDGSLGIQLVNLYGDPITSVTADAGKASFSFLAVREVPAGMITGRMPAYWALGALAPLAFIAPPPDSGAWYDDDGDGRPDHLKVWLHLAWTNATQVSAGWPNRLNVLTLDPLTMNRSADGLVLDVRYPAGVEGGTSAATTDLGRWSRDGDPEKAFPIFDRVAPVPMRALIYRGTIWDTLRVLASESVQAVVARDDVLRKLGPNGALPSYNFGDQWLDVVTKEYVFLFSATQTQNIPVPGDWVRFAPAGKARDGLGNAPGVLAKSVPILGTDRPPTDAVMLDSDGDGRADRVVLRLTQPLSPNQTWLFRWPDSSGGLDVRFASSATRVDSNGLKLTFDLPPYQWGQTACPGGDCARLGSLVANFEGLQLSTSFTIRDGVPPVVLRGKLTFSGDDLIPDTLKLVFSEPVVGRTDKRSVVSIGDTVPGARGTQVELWNSTALPWKIRFDSAGRTAYLLVDTNLAIPKPEQGIRLNPGSAGLADYAGNLPGDTAAWGGLELGPIPPRLGVWPYPAIGRWDGRVPSASEPVLQLAVRRGIASGSEWKSLSGKPIGRIDTTGGRSSLVGAKLQLNDLTDGAAYLYDNMGVFLAKIDLAPVLEAVKSGMVEVDPRGRYEVWIGWNGVARGKIAPSGIYLMRVVAHRKVGNQLTVRQKVVRMGWMIFEPR